MILWLRYTNYIDLVIFYGKEMGVTDGCLALLPTPSINGIPGN